MKTIKIDWDQMYKYVGNYVNKFVTNTYDVKEITQLTIVKVLMKVNSSYEERGKFMPWVYVVSRNVIRDYYNKKDFSYSEISELELDIPDPEIQKDFDVLYLEERMDIAIGKLSGVYLTMIRHYLENGNITKVALKYGVYRKVIYNLINESKDKLKLILKQMHHDHLYNTSRFSELYSEDDKCMDIRKKIKKIRKQSKSNPYRKK